MNSKVDMGRMDIKYLFFKFATPAVISSIIMSLYTIIDGIFIGRGVGSVGLAAVNLAMPFIFFISAFSIMVTIGGGTFIGVSLGQKNKENANNAFSVSFFILVIFSILITIFTNLFLNKITLFLKADEITFEHLKNYLKILSYFSFAFSITYLLELSIRSQGYPIFAMIFTSTGAIFNIFLDYILVIKYNLGTYGAAWATGISQFIPFIVFFIFIISKKSIIKFKIPKFQKNMIIKIFYNGSSEFLSQISVGITTFLYNWVLIKNLGNIGVSAYSIISYISVFIISFIMGISSGIAPIISYNYGGKNIKRIKKLMKYAVITGFMIGIISLIVVLLFSEQITKLFITNNVELLKITSEANKVYSIGFVLMGFNIIASSFFTAITDAKTSILISSLRTLILFIINLLILPIIIGYWGLWLVVPITETFTFFYSTYKYKKFKLKYEN
ncbi:MULTISPECIES: MATE family efflux transporter [Oceanotoga]|uniref:Multidrug export protein MepA n=1 Tax=Oceanotoga teriensis TaxID=515440 RepID=A0AA45C7B8_9BACT|nr:MULTISPECIES: MATE family efflux transporter [Oceanotoga]MDN5341545.1 hypothetical protein [Oceanotoga sp.]MDO7977781.1 MATE family efflux transporter [Oceanotoga teriensis]PWJ95312.1 putative MATE family efflux protein [Oceanotoga teriensis]